MLQCKDCELYETGPNNQKTFKCDPFSTIKEAECLAKWQLLRLDMLVAGYRSMLNWQEKMSPMQDKIFKYVQRELSDLDEADQWKIAEDQDEEEEDQDDQRP